MSQRCTLQKFLQKLKAKHPNKKYNTSKVDYVNSTTKVIITCLEKDEFNEIHGDFSATPSNLLNGFWCPKCGKVHRYTTEEFIKKAKLKHGEKYCYNKTQYKTTVDKVIITCPEHGDFLQSPNKHLMGRGCPLCGELKKGKKRITTEEFIQKAQNVHGDFYNYSKTQYKLTHKKFVLYAQNTGSFGKCHQTI